MEFIREKIKEKPISKRRIMMRLGIAALCGLVFVLAVCLALLIALPLIKEKWQQEATGVGTESELGSETIENQANKSIVMVTRMENEKDFLTNGYEAKGQGSGLIIAEDNNYIYIFSLFIHLKHFFSSI